MKGKKTPNNQPTKNKQIKTHKNTPKQQLGLFVPFFFSNPLKIFRRHKSAVDMVMVGS